MSGQQHVRFGVMVLALLGGLAGCDSVPRRLDVCRSAAVQQDIIDRILRNFPAEGEAMLNRVDRIYTGSHDQNLSGDFLALLAERQARILFGAAFHIDRVDEKGRDKEGNVACQLEFFLDRYADLKAPGANLSDRARQILDEEDFADIRKSSLLIRLTPQGYRGRIDYLVDKANGRTTMVKPDEVAHLALYQPLFLGYIKTINKGFLDDEAASAELESAVGDNLNLEDLVDNAN